MTRLLFLPLLILFTLGTLLTVGASLVAGRVFHEPTPIEIEFGPDAQSETCSIPCWRGIVPGQTFRSSAHTILTDNGYSLWSSTARAQVYHHEDASRCEVALHTTNEERLDGEIDGRVYEIRLLSCSNTILGDVMLVLQQPDVTSTSGLLISFRDGIAHVYTRMRICDSNRVTPFIRVDAVVLSERMNAVMDSGQQWRGFVTYNELAAECGNRRVG